MTSVNINEFQVPVDEPTKQDQAKFFKAQRKFTNETLLSYINNYDSGVGAIHLWTDSGDSFKIINNVHCCGILEIGRFEYLTKQGMLNLILAAQEIAKERKKGLVRASIKTVNKPMLTILLQLGFKVVRKFKNPATTANLLVLEWTP
ncbi:MAG: hypothetical protein ACREAE_02590 [Nitrosopumilaceae archaeon]